MNRTLQRAIHKAGGYRAVGRALGVSHVSILKWERVPAARVMDVERITGIPRHILRRDLYPPERERRAGNGAKKVSKG